MKKYLAKSTESSLNSKNKFAMFIGRWQFWHKGHRWLIDQALNDGKKVLLCIRDVDVDGDKNLWTSQQIYFNLSNELADLIEEGNVSDINKYIAAGKYQLYNQCLAD